MPAFTSHSMLGLAFLLVTGAKPASANGFIEYTQQLEFVEQQHTVSVAIAANESERERGLMLQRELGENQGMLFVYPDEANRGVWMKNTLIALDVLFLSGDSRIVAVIKNLPPCLRDPCRIYDSKLPARYILELRAGYVDKLRIKVGQPVSLPAKRLQDR